MAENVEHWYGHPSWATWSSYHPNPGNPGDKSVYGNGAKPPSMMQYGGGKKRRRRVNQLARVDESGSTESPNADLEERKARQLTEDVSTWHDGRGNNGGARLAASISFLFSCGSALLVLLAI